MDNNEYHHMRPIFRNAIDWHLNKPIAAGLMLGYPVLGFFALLMVGFTGYREAMEDYWDDCVKLFNMRPPTTGERR